MSIEALLGRINQFILNPLIFLFFGIALLVFFWGIFRFIYRNDDESEREQGKRSMVWGLVGMLIMFSVFGIINLILRTLGIPASYPFN